MRQNRGSLVATAAALALSFAATVPAWGAAKETAGGVPVTREAIVLRVSVEGEIFEVTALFGEPMRMRTRSGSAFHLVPTLGPDAGEAARSVALEVYELLQADGAELVNLVEVVPLPPVGQGSATASTLGRALEIEPVALREVAVPEHLTGGDASLRPVQCCLTCPDGEFCAFCVHASCGVCCAF